VTRNPLLFSDAVIAMSMVRSEKPEVILLDRVDPSRAGDTIRGKRGASPPGSGS
jgi:hypothetical protein